MNETEHDLIIIGCGIGGGALATVMARAGYSVLALERSAVYRDRVRGEWMAMWGVAEAKRLGLYDVLMEAGGHHLTRHCTYGDGVNATEAEVLDMSALSPESPGPLCLGHPTHCQTLHDAALAAGATVLRETNVDAITLGKAPSVTYTHGGEQHTATARLVVGADGRGSIVRRAAGIPLHRDETHHLFSGLLVENAHGWPEDLQAMGSQGDGYILIFPQGNGRARLYLGYPKEQNTRLNGDDGPQRFLEAFAIEGMPHAEAITNATPAGPCNSYPNEDAWTDEPFAEGALLIGDAAGWNDPIIGQGLSITYRDVRIVSELMRENDSWTPALFAPYADERAERMRRLRFAATISSTLFNEFGDEAHEQRVRAFERRAANPMLQLPGLATLIGPENVPATAFEPAIREQMFAP